MDEPPSRVDYFGEEPRRYFEGDIPAAKKDPALKRFIPIVVAAAALYLVYSLRAPQTLPGRSTSPVSSQRRSAQSEVDAAFRDRRSSIQVAGSGVVSRILKDGLEGGRHQRFILTLASGTTLLVAHNIDIAPRIQNLSLGDTVSFVGEYEWNKRGGVLHWTHRDPANRHPHGRLEHEGKVYQ